MRAVCIVRVIARIAVSTGGKRHYDTEPTFIFSVKNWLVDLYCFSASMCVFEQGLVEGNELEDVVYSTCVVLITGFLRDTLE